VGRTRGGYPEDEDGRYPLRASAPARECTLGECVQLKAKETGPGWAEGMNEDYPPQKEESYQRIEVIGTGKKYQNFPLWGEGRMASFKDHTGR